MFTSRQEARNVVEEFLGRGYGDYWFWDDMIGTPTQGRFGCVLQYVECGLPKARWPKVGFVAGRQLRHKYPYGKKRWNAKDWSVEIDPILDLIAKCANERSALPPPELVETEPVYTPSTEKQESGFVPWQLFRKRHGVPTKNGGVYLFAYYEGLPESVVDMLGAKVIYIGYTGCNENDRFLAQRLDEFARTAHGGLGHSAGWTYRTEFATDWASLQLFRNTYISWREFERKERPTACQFETDCIEKYKQKYGRRPFLNRRD